MPALQRRPRVPAWAPAARLLGGASIPWRRGVSCSRERMVSRLLRESPPAPTVSETETREKLGCQVLLCLVVGGGRPGRGWGGGAGSSPGRGSPVWTLILRTVCVVPVSPLTPGTAAPLECAVSRREWGCARAITQQLCAHFSLTSGRSLGLGKAGSGSEGTIYVCSWVHLHFEC